jgi:CBS domain-containing protein
MSNHDKSGDERSGGEKARDVMTRNPTTVMETASLQDVARVMKESDTGVVPVCDDAKKVIGLVTDRDIVVRVIAEGKNVTQEKVSGVMTKGVKTVRENDSVDSVFRLMSDEQVRRVPVVNDQDEIVGIIAQADLATRLNKDRKLGQTVENISEGRANNSPRGARGVSHARPGEQRKRGAEAPRFSFFGASSDRRRAGRRPPLLGSLPPECGLIDRASLDLVLLLVVRTRFDLHVALDLRVEDPFDLYRCLLEVLAMIGHVVADRIALHHPDKSLQHLFADEPALSLSRSRPRVGKVNVDLVDRFRRQQLLHEQTGVVIHDHGVGECLLADLRLDHAVVMQRPLDSDEVRAGVCGG